MALVKISITGTDFYLKDKKHSICEIIIIIIDVIINLITIITILEIDFPGPLQ